MSQKDIFKVLIAHHDIQRKLCDELENKLSGNLTSAKKHYEILDAELKAHAAAEERHLYIPAMQHDEGLDLSRHAIAEHHEMDEMMATLNDGRTGDENWHNTAKALIDKVRHHLKEEEQEFFKEARKILDNDLQKRLGQLYEAEHQAFEQTIS